MERKRGLRMERERRVSTASREHRVVAIRHIRKISLFLLKLKHSAPHVTWVRL